jgi:peptidoglycan/xylan/chitin deacetylase (PgdA/CDA1 family)
VPLARLLLYGATAVALVLVARALLLAPPPVSVSALALLAYVVLILVGVFFLRLQMFTDALLRGPKGARGVVLTFDDGPDPETTPRVLDVLDAEGARATFFVIAKKAEKHPELVREIKRRGHGIGLHSYAHDRLFALRSQKRVAHDLARGMAVLEAITGERPELFRPPIGHTNPAIARVIDALDLTVVGWSLSARDGIAGAEPASVVARVRRHVKDGTIVLLHDAAERGGRVPAGVHALAEVIDAVKAARLDVVPLEGWLGGGEPPLARDDAG